MLVSQYLDKLLGLKSDLKVHFKHSFSADIEKFMDKSSDYTFYHAVTQKPLPVYEYDDLTLENATTTIVDLKKKTRKRPTVPEQLIDPKHLYVPYPIKQKLRMTKNESKLVF